VELRSRGRGYDLPAVLSDIGDRCVQIFRDIRSTNLPRIAGQVDQGRPLQLFPEVFASEAAV
jgi:hypothetical protein